MENLILAGNIRYKGSNYSLYWDPSDGEIWFSQDNEHSRYQIAHLSAPSKEMVAEIFINFLKSQENI
jgi:hypothetical protein